MNRPIPLLEAKERAIELAEILEPFCERIEVAGSIRRQMPNVKDIELVAIPRLVPAGGSLFAETAAAESQLDRALKTLTSFTAEPGVARHRLAFDTVNKKNGPRYKRLRFDGIGVDLFLVLPPAQWGVIHLLRTGPAEFTKRIVTQRSKGGLLPDALRVHEGQLCEYGAGGWKVLPTPSERDLFGLIGLEFIEPARRTASCTPRLCGTAKSVP